MKHALAPFMNLTQIFPIIMQKISQYYGLKVLNMNIC